MKLDFDIGQLFRTHGLLLRYILVSILAGSALNLCPSAGAQNETGTLKAYRVDESSKPVLDGELFDHCWQNAEKATGFWIADGSRQVEHSAVAQIAYDEEHIYVAFRAPLENDSAPQTFQTFLDPFLEHQREFGLSEDLTRRFWFRRDPRIFRFTVDRDNTRDSHMVGVPWYKVPWESATHHGIENGVRFWSAEAAIPIASVAYFELATGTEDSWIDRWGINFAYGDTLWIADFTPKKNTIPLRKYNPRVDREAFPLRYGLLTDLDFNSAPYRWYYNLDANSGEPKTGPRVIGDVQIVLTISNFTDKHRQVTVVGKQIQTDGTTNGSPYVATQDYDVAPTGVRWGYGSLKLPVTEPGKQLVLLSVVENKTGRVLSHRPLLIQPIEIGYGLWDRSFYMKESTAQLKLVVDRSVKLGPSVRCELRPKGERKILLSKTGTWKKTDGTYQTRITFDLMSIPVGDYVVTATAEGQEQHPFDVELRKLPYKPGAVQYTDYGALLRDGKPVFPTGCFYVKNYLRKEPDFRREYAEAGFTTFMLEWMGPAGFIETSRTMSEVDLFPVMGMQKFGYEVTQWDERNDYSWNSLLNGRLPMVRKAVSMVTSMAQENIMTWMTRDEPNENMYNVVKAYHDIIREIDPYHPTYIPFAQAVLFPAYRNAVDIPGPYVYPNFPGGNVSIGGERTAKAVREMPGRPVMPVLQTFVPIDHQTGKPRKGARQPNRAELRCMAFHSIINGASGIIFFSYHHTGPQKLVYPETWANVKELVGHLKILTPVILAPPSTDIEVKADDREGIQARLYSHDNQLYVIAVNHEQQQQHNVKFTLESLSQSLPRIQQARVMFEDRQLVVKDRVWKDDFAPYEVHIYELGVQQ